MLMIMVMVVVVVVVMRMVMMTMMEMLIAMAKAMIMLHYHAMSIVMPVAMWVARGRVQWYLLLRQQEAATLVSSRADTESFLSKWRYS